MAEEVAGEVDMLVEFLVLVRLCHVGVVEPIHPVLNALIA
jgi:hypothetical protein